MNVTQICVMPNIQTRINAAFDYFAGDLRPYQKNGSYLDKDELPFFVCLKSTAPISPKHNIALATCSVKLTALWISKGFMVERTRLELVTS